AEQQDALETGDRLGEVFGSHAISKDGAKPGWILLMGVQALNGSEDARAHLQRAGDRLKGLLLQRRRPAIPEEYFAIGAVQEGRRVSMSPLAADTCGEARSSRKAVFGFMTARARHCAVRRKDWVEEQPAAELDFGLGQRIVLRHGAIALQA